MMLDDVIGSDRDEFPLEQVRNLLRRLPLDEDWDEPGESGIQGILSETPRPEPVSS